MTELSKCLYTVNDILRNSIVYHDDPVKEGIMELDIEVSCNFNPISLQGKSDVMAIWTKLQTNPKVANIIINCANRFKAINDLYGNAWHEFSSQLADAIAIIPSSDKKEELSESICLDRHTSERLITSDALYTLIYNNPWFAFYLCIYLTETIPITRSGK